jgi:predicted transcriptional regulator
MEKLLKRAKELQAEGFSYLKIAKLLNKEGFKNNRGKPLSNNAVYYYLNGYSGKIRRASAELRPDFTNARGIMPLETSLIQQVTKSSLSNAAQQQILGIILQDLSTKTA